MEAGETVYQQDIADIVAMSFPQVPVAETDRIIVLFRKKYRFGLFFDFNRQGLGSIAKLEQELGTLYRQLSYHNVYDALANSDTFQKVIQSGWFPFVEIINAEFDQFLKHQESGFDIELFEKEIIKAFDDQRLESMFNRWMAKPHFKDKSLILRSAIDSYRSGNSIAVLKTVLTEIEGIIREAYRSVHNKSAKLDALLDFAVKSAELRTGAANTLFFPTAFAQYLQSHMNANFDPVNKTGTASSRHAVGHGAADQNSYTMANALKSLLTLDQLYFYT